LEVLRVYARIILKWILEIYARKARTGFIWLRISINGRIFKNDNETSGSKNVGISF
jgi:hypothetical protein